MKNEVCDSKTCTNYDPTKKNTRKPQSIECNYCGKIIKMNGVCKKEPEYYDIMIRGNGYPWCTEKA